MIIELRMPALSPTMETGTLAKWLVGIGDRVQAGDRVAEIETDKAAMEYEAADDGWIAELTVPEGMDDIAVGTVIALMRNEPVAPATGDMMAETVLAALTPTVEIPAPGNTISSAGDIRASPLATRIAAQRGIDLATLDGSGPNGRIVTADLGLQSKPVADPVPPLGRPQTARTEPPAGVPFTSGRLSGMRKAIAHRLALAKQTVPHFYLSMDCRIDALLGLRADLNAALIPRGERLSINDLLIKALARALEEVPEANAQYAGDELYRFERVDISVAVAIAGGLLTPVVIDAGRKSLSAIARETRALADLARDGGLAPEQYQGGTVSISNLGMQGIERIFPVINPPQAMILGVGAATERFVPIERAPTLATMISLTASFDHRAIDGADGARVMSALRTLIEAPLRLAV